MSAHTKGVNYRGRWTAEVSGWSEHFITYIAALEGLQKNSFEEKMLKLCKVCGEYKEESEEIKPKEQRMLINIEKRIGSIIKQINLK